MRAAHTLVLTMLLVACTSTTPSSEGVEPVAACGDANSTVSKYESFGPIAPPRITRRIEPRGRGVLANYPAVATMQAIVGADGVPTSICLASGDQLLGRAVAAAMKQWRFEPATLDGDPVPARISFTFANMRGIYDLTGGVCANNTPGCTGRVIPGITDVPRGNTPPASTN